MNLSLTKLFRCVPELNKRPLTDADLYRICRREKVKLHNIPLRVPGFYMVIRGKPHIYVNGSLRGVAWLLAAFHELGHHLLHAPPHSTVAYFYKLKPNTKEENEAEAFALIALIPESLLLKLIASEEYAEDYGFPSELLNERCEFYARYRH
jgi:Zn-dependent peptidase ImmA (M78 family)